MTSNRLFSLWLSFSVFFCATFVQVHEIEHIPESFHSQHSFSFIELNHSQSPLEQAVDQCEICIHSIVLDESAIFAAHSYVVPLQTAFLAFLDFNGLSAQATWSSSQPRAPPFYI